MNHLIITRLRIGAIRSRPIAICYIRNPSSVGMSGFFISKNNNCILICLLSTALGTLRAQPPQMGHFVCDAAGLSRAAADSAADQKQKVSRRQPGQDTQACAGVHLAGRPW